MNRFPITREDVELCDKIEAQGPPPLVMGGEGRHGEDLAGPDSWIMLLLYALLIAGAWQVGAWIFGVSCWFFS